MEDIRKMLSDNAVLPLWPETGKIGRLMRPIRKKNPRRGCRGLVHFTTKDFGLCPHTMAKPLL
jgi:hypothetical protein